MIDVPVPLEQEGTKAIVRNWLKKPGEHVRADEPLVELETDKVTQEVAAPGEGILEFILLETGAEALPGALLGKLREIDAASSLPEAPTAPPPAGRPVSPVQGSIRKGTAAAFLSPSVRRAVREHAIDVGLIDGTGRGGRITRADIDQHL
ncbi:MAG TPA: E3 binding domain-containing protein, partial [Rhabdaerophilum sp.]|nr:E3 binding domain-containing protein [Rhabdaerophilum sp.]